MEFILNVDSFCFKEAMGSPDKLREVVLKFNEQNALDEMILAPERNNKVNPFLKDTILP